MWWVDEDDAGRPDPATSRLLAVTAATAIGIAVFLIGLLWHGYALLEKYPPDWTAFGWGRTSACGVAAILLYLGLRPPGSATRKAAPLAFERLIFKRAYRAALVLLLLTVGIVLTIPELLNETVREGQFLSIATEIVLAGALIFFGLAIRHARAGQIGAIPGFRGSTVIAAMMAVVVLILLEEMSWGQHWLGFATPERFAGNSQNETNLHNFYTYRFELAYYATAVMVFVVAPFSWPNRTWNQLSQLSFYIPPRIFALIALPVCGLVFEAWNIVPYQILFFLGVLIAIDLAALSPATRFSDRIAAAVAALVLVLSQAVFLSQGHRMVDGYELSEVREFMISVMILVYAAWLEAKLEYRPSQPKRVHWG